MHQEVDCGSRRYFEVEDFVEKVIRNREEVEERTEWVRAWEDAMLGVQGEDAIRGLTPRVS
jgi:hypothetical protein